MLRQLKSNACVLKIRALLLRILAMVAGEGFSSELFSVRLQLKHIILQKLIGFNRHVPWPVHWTSKITAVKNIQRGTRCPGLASGCHIDGRNGIIIEENVWIGPRVSLISMNHDPDDYDSYMAADPIIIRKNCWLATNAIVLAGIELGEHTIVAAGAVVTKSFPQGNQILAGNPAKVIRELGEYSAK